MKFLLNALLAATALIPAAASAQDAPWQRGDRGDRGPRAERMPVSEAAQPQRPEGDRGPRVEARARADGGVDPQRGWNRGIHADGGGQPRWQQPQPQPQAQPQPRPQPQAQVQPQQRQWNDRRGLPNDGDNRIVQSDGRGGGDWDRQRDFRPAPVQPNQPQPGFRDGRRTAGDWDRQRGDQQRDDGRRNVEGRYDYRNAWGQQRDGEWRGNEGRGNQWQGDRSHANRGAWNRTWRNDRQYDWNRYRTGNRDAYRLPRYYAPYGWEYGYRRFSVGVTLSSVLWGENYWIDDPYDYRLPQAYGPYRWVRYYNDALLVDTRYGQVVDVVYDIFW